MFDHISKQLEVCQKYSATRRLFNSLLSVWKCGQKRLSCSIYYLSHSLVPQACLVFLLSYGQSRANQT